MALELEGRRKKIIDGKGCKPSWAICTAASHRHWGEEVLHLCTTGSTERRRMARNGGLVERVVKGAREEERQERKVAPFGRKIEGEGLSYSEALFPLKPREEVVRVEIDERVCEK